MTDQAPTPISPPEPPFHWGLGLVIVGVGVAVTVGGFLLLGRDDAEAYWESAIVNLGTTILLAAALVWLERALVRSVRRNTQQVAQQAATQAADAAAKQTADRLLPSIEELDRRIFERTRAAASERAASAVRVGEEATYEAMSAALAGAEDIHAIARSDMWSRGGMVTVPASEDLAGPRIQVTFLPQTEASPERVVLEYVNGATVASRTFWEPDVAPEDVFSTFQEQMIADGHGAAQRAMSAEQFFKNLSSILVEAVEARRGEDGLWLSGKPVLEKVSDLCVVTEAGIEMPMGVVVKRSQFGYKVGYPGTYRVINEDLPQAAPAEVDPMLLAAAIAVARRHFQKPPRQTPY